jgi:membrane protein EpsK
MGSIIIWRYLIPTMHISFHDFKVSTFRSLTCIGGWFFVTQLGSLLFLSIDLIVVNRMLGADASGRYGAILQWSALLRSLAGVMAGVFGPTIFMLYARQDIPGLVRYAQQAVRFLGIIMALPIGLICGFSNALLSVWLGPDYSSLSPLMTLLTIHLSVNLGVLPLFNIRVATKKVRVPGIVLCIMGIMNLSLAILFAGPFGWGLYGVAGASAIILTLGNLVFGPWYAAYILAVPRSTFFRGTLPNILLTLGFTTVCGIMAHYCHIHTWIGLASGGFLLAITYCVFIYFIYMTILERQALRSIVRRSVNHFKS